MGVEDKVRCKNERTRRKLAGLCQKCAAKLPEDHGCLQCERCRLQINKRRRNRYTRLLNRPHKWKWTKYKNEERK